MSLTIKDKTFVVASFAICIGTGLLARRALGEAGWSLAVALAAGIVVLVQIGIYRRLESALMHYNREPTVNYRQIEALFSLHASLHVERPLPPMRVAAIAPDFANTLILLIHEIGPRLIVEAGSGVSTLVAAYCLRKTGQGRVLSLEQDRRYGELSRRHLASHGLHDVATVIDAPLTPVVLQGQAWEWYDLRGLAGLDPIDLLIVDGPVQVGQRTMLMRYPALPLLHERLSPHAVILLDDGDRDAERCVVDRWLKEFVEFKREIVPSEKGTVILRKKW